MEVKELSLVVDLAELPAFQGAEEKQRKLIEENPFIEITDNKSYELAKQYRTTLRGGRYELQNGEKTIASRLKDFRDLIKSKTAELIGITLDAENKQQAEIERYEAEKAREKEEALRVERERKEALRQQVFNFNSTKAKAIETATITTIAAIISDIENSDLQLEEFTADFLASKSRLIEEAKRKETQLQEAEQLRIDLEKAAEERRKLEEDRKKLEAERKKQEEQLKAQREEEEAELKRKREEEEAKLKAEREKMEAQKAELAKLEKERLQREEAERKEKFDFMVNQRTERIRALGLEYDSDKNALLFNGRQVMSNFNISDSDDGTFTHEIMPKISSALENEKKRIELTKSDKQKLTEMIEAFDTSQFIIELESAESRVLLNEFINLINKVRQQTIELISEL